MNKQLNLEQLKNFKSILKDGKERIKNTYFQTHNAKQLLAEHSKLIDNILCELWNIFLSNCYEKNNNNSNERYAPALVAVGGYGRQELYPHSDIDLLIILAQSATTELSENIENLITVLWDLGLKIGHSV
ncbi:MAG: nucleotidyltransferase domain-containing protein, partial [Rhodocyclaceae bacterium]